jgi:hypothetical protein
MEWMACSSSKKTFADNANDKKNALGDYYCSGPSSSSLVAISSEALEAFDSGIVMFNAVHYSFFLGRACTPLFLLAFI